jgi:hypothetical protein
VLGKINDLKDKEKKPPRLRICEFTTPDMIVLHVMTTYALQKVLQPVYA